MRIYSDKLLAWHEVLHTAYAARINPGKWQNMHIYKIQRTQPAIIRSSSPIELLQKSRKYYLYDNLIYNNTCGHIGNYMDVVRSKSGISDTYIHLPFTVAPQDVIVIHENIGGHGEPILA